MDQKLEKNVNWIVHEEIEGHLDYIKINYMKKIKENSKPKYDWKWSIVHKCVNETTFRSVTQIEWGGFEDSGRLPRKFERSVLLLDID